MKKVCCVCGKDLGEVPGPPQRLTHGFCEACYRSELQTWEARRNNAVEKARVVPQPVPDPRSV